MKRCVLHIDCNKFYASVECLYRPELRDKPMAVGGDPENRHGIILTKNEIASKYGLTVGEPLWKARQKCPDLVVVPPNYPLYLRFSALARKIYEDYSEFIEPFGLDECWIDVTGNEKSGEEIAHEIRKRVKSQLGITVSVGVSFNKVFAKLGSDYKKPDAVTVIDESNYKDIAWSLPCGDLLMVGRSAQKKLNAYGINTIGDLADTDVAVLKSLFGKNGEMLHSFANGTECSPVRHKDEISDVKSVGNSTTAPRDLVNEEDVKTVFRVLCESVSTRLREKGLKGRVVTIYVRDKELSSFSRQMKIPANTDISTEIFYYAMKLFCANYFWNKPIRSLGVSVSDFDVTYEQFDFEKTVENREKQERLETAVDSLRRRFGNYCIGRACQLKDTELSKFNPHEEHIIHPVGFFS
ncbi:DNA polymerase IV [uncultured Eubacterium sp.]|uniref:DNA polymerase IV n=1 Tax=uncultured Eubacterium sp. TaxID=165185 RepID=UPI0025D88B39|nr:DNA polymerase IV [uncultured Eubacterium sp.]